MHSSFPNPPLRRRGFTLLEVLLSIAIMALVATVLIGGSVRLLSEQPATPYDVFWKAVREARKTALQSEHEIRLKFDKEKKAFLLIDGLAPTALASDGMTLEEKPLKLFQILTATDDLTVDFLPASSKGGNTILLGGVVVETTTLRHVTFYADGTCTPFRAQFMRNGGSSVLEIDPWTCAPVLPAVDPNAPTS